jgi:hypothetical protein
MRPSLLHPGIGERGRHVRRSRATRGSSEIRESDTAVRPETAHTPEPAPIPDFATRRVRAAGGPLDRASYACQCGYVFAAAVTTTVECPHCGGSQAW